MFDESIAKQGRVNDEEEQDYDDTDAEKGDYIVGHEVHPSAIRTKGRPEEIKQQPTQQQEQNSCGHAAPEAVGSMAKALVLPPEPVGINHFFAPLPAEEVVPSPIMAPREEAGKEGMGASGWSRTAHPAPVA